MIYLQFSDEAPASGYWDQHIVEECFNEDHVFVVPGGAQAAYVDNVNRRLAEEPYGVVIITSDEQYHFPWHKLDHPFIRVYVQYHFGADKQIPLGSTPDGPTKGPKDIDLFFAGQTNTVDRKACAAAVQTYGGYLQPSDGFAQGLPKEKYNELMSRAKIVPCPAGAVVDSFRLYEALEAGCTPVVNNRQYFTRLFGEFPFPCVDDWRELKNIEYRDYSEWWADFKKQLTQGLKDDLWTLQSLSQAAR